jgi:hypothetical protein
MRNLVSELEGKRPHESKRHVSKDNIKLDLDGVIWIPLDQDRRQPYIPNSAIRYLKIYLAKRFNREGRKFRKRTGVKKSIR